MKRLLTVALTVAACNQGGLGPQPASSSSPAEMLCQFDAPKDPSRVVLATFDADTLQLFHADASHTAAYVFGSAGAANVFNQMLATRSGRVAAAASWVDNPNGQGDWHQELVLVDASGDVRWKHESIATGSPQLFLAANGALAVVLGTDGLVVDASGNEHALPQLMPIGEPIDDGGTVAAQGPWQGDTPGPLGWVKAGESTLTPLGLTPAQPAATPMLVAGRLIYLALDGSGAPVLVSERPGDVKTVPLPGVDVTTNAVTSQTATGWVIVGQWRAPQYRVNVKTLEAEPVGLHIPVGLRPFASSIQGMTLDGDGALLWALRDDYSGALYRSANPDGTSWSRLGGTVTNVLDIDVLAHGGTYLIDGTTARYAQETWSPAPPADKPDYDGDSVQVARPQSSLARALPMDQKWVEVTDLQLTGDGLCLAYWDTAQDGSSTALTAWDLGRDKSFTLDVRSTAAAIAWTE
jgi:hypothetical protein